LCGSFDLSFFLTASRFWMYLYPSESYPSVHERCGWITFLSAGRDSSVGTAASYGTDGSGIESPWGRSFPHPSRPAVGPTQPLVEWKRNLVAHSDAREEKWRGKRRMEWVASSLQLDSEHSQSSVTTPADINGLVRFAGRPNLVSARVPSHSFFTLQWLLCVFPWGKVAEAWHWTHTPSSVEVQCLRYSLFWDVTQCWLVGGYRKLIFGTEGHWGVQNSRESLWLFCLNCRGFVFFHSFCSGK